MRRLIYFVVSFIVWLLLTWTLEIQVVVAGLAASFVVALLFHEILPKEHHVFEQGSGEEIVQLSGLVSFLQIHIE